MEKGNQKAALVPLLSGNLGSLVLLIKKMTSLQYSKSRGDQPGHLFGAPATPFPKLIKAARNFPTLLGLGRRGGSRKPISNL